MKGWHAHSLLRLTKISKIEQSFLLAAGIVYSQHSKTVADYLTRMPDYPHPEDAYLHIDERRRRILEDSRG